MSDRDSHSSSVRRRLVVGQQLITDSSSLNLKGEAGGGEGGEGVELTLTDSSL